MKTILVIRHAKSSWDYPELDDFDRPLRNKGIKRTKKICDYLKAKQLIADLIVTSKAKRAKDTAKFVAQYLGISEELIKEEENFYPGSGNAFMETIKELNDNYSHVALIGHNPALTDTVNQMIVNKYIDWIPTSAVVQLTHESSRWNSVGWNEWELANYITPKQI